MDFDVEALTSRRVKFKKLKALCAKVGCPGVTTGEQMVLTLLAKLETCTEPLVETGTEWWQAEAPANFMDVHSSEELNQVLESSQEQNKLLVVEFYKQDCPACKSMYPKVWICRSRRWICGSRVWIIRTTISLVTLRGSQGDFLDRLIVRCMQCFRPI